MFTSLVLVTTMLLGQGAPAMTERILIDHHRAIRLRDGVTVYADVYRPARDGRFPTIVVRTPYGVQRENVGVHDRLIQLARMGYAVVNTDVRGRYESEGAWDPFRSEGRDGDDVVQWAATQSWSTGKVTTQGGSYLGHVQWATLGEQPPALVAAFPAVASTNLYKNWITHGGAFHLAFNFGWGVVRMPFRIMQPQLYFTGRDAAPGRHLVQQLPAVRPQPEHGGSAGEGDPAARRAADHPPLRRQAERDRVAGGEGVLSADGQPHGRTHGGSGSWSRRCRLVAGSGRAGVTVSAWPDTPVPKRPRPCAAFELAGRAWPATWAGRRAR